MSSSGVASEAVESAAGLRRDLHLLDATAVGLGAIIGAGIFVVTGVAARVAGPSFVLGLLLAGVAAACNGLSAAQLAAAYPRSGGTYEYGYRLLGPGPGFAAGWLFLVSKLAAGGTVALGFDAAVAAFWPAVPPRAAGVAAAIALTAVNCCGIKKAGRLNLAIVVASVSVLLAFVAVGLRAFDPAHLVPFAPRGARGLLESAALLFFAYTGYARVATLGEEVHEPRRTIPRAIVLALATSMVLYLAVATVAVGAIGAEAMGASASPLVEAARAFPVRSMPTIVAAGAGIALLGVLLSQVFGVSRMVFAMARRRDLPSYFQEVDGARAVPRRAIVLTGALIVAVALVGTLDLVIGSASFAILLYYTITNVAALRLPAEDRLYPRAIAVLGLVLCLLLAASLSMATVAIGLAWLVAGFVLRAVVGARAD